MEEAWIYPAGLPKCEVLLGMPFLRRNGMGLRWGRGRIR